MIRGPGQCLNPACPIDWHPGIHLPEGWLLCRQCLRDERLRHFPTVHHQRHKLLKYPFDTMAVGETLTIESPRANVAAAASQFGYRWGKRFSVYRIPGETRRCTLTRTK